MVPAMGHRLDQPPTISLQSVYQNWISIIDKNYSHFKTQNIGQSILYSEQRVSDETMEAQRNNGGLKGMADLILAVCDQWSSSGLCASS